MRRGEKTGRPRCDAYGRAPSNEHQGAVDRPARGGRGRARDSLRALIASTLLFMWGPACDGPSSPSDAATGAAMDAPSDPSSPSTGDATVDAETSDCEGAGSACADAAQHPSASDAGTIAPIDGGSAAASDAEMGSPLDAGAAPDAGAPFDAGPGEAGTDPGTDSGMAAPDADVAMPDAGPDGCLLDAQCDSGHCAPTDGVCCETACDGPCVACLFNKTGERDGLCAPILTGTDPDGECAAQDPQTCGASGAGCNGDPAAPACLAYDLGTECGPPVCRNGTATPARRCDGDGHCVPQAAVACGAYICDDAQAACLADCESDEACADGHVCGTSRTCVVNRTGAEILWLRSWQAPLPKFHSSQHNFFSSLQVDSRGNVIFANNCTYNAMDLQDLLCGGNSGSAVYRLDPAGENLESFDLGWRALNPSASLCGDDAVVVGFTANYLGTSRLKAGVTQLGRDWQPSWSHLYDDVSAIIALQWQTADPAGNVFAMFHGKQTWPVGIDYGDGNLIGGFALIKYDPTGAVLWSRSWPGKASPVSDGVVYVRASDRFFSDAAGNLYGATSGDAAAMFGCGDPNTPATSLYVHKLDPDAACLFGRDFGGTMIEAAIGHDAANNLYVAAVVTDTVDFGLGPLSPIGARDLVLAKLDPSGQALWHARYGDVGTEGTVSVSVTPGGEMVIGGTFSGSLDFGVDQPLAAATRASYLARLDTDGGLVRQYAFVGVFRHAVGHGREALVISEDEALDLGNGLVLPGASGLVLAKLRL